MTGIPPYYDWISHHAGRRPKQIAINDLQTARIFAYADLHRRADRLAGAPVEFRETPLALNSGGKILKRELREPCGKGFTRAVN